MIRLSAKRSDRGKLIRLLLVLVFVVGSFAVAATATAAPGNPGESAATGISIAPVEPAQSLSASTVSPSPVGKAGASSEAAGKPSAAVRSASQAPGRAQLRPSNLKQADLDTARANAWASSRVKKAVDPDMKILVIAADGTEPDLAALQAFLGQIGVPYDTLIASKTPLTASMLSDGVSHGYYDAIMLASGSLIYYDTAAGTYPSALTAAQWQILWTYEAQFNVRQVTLATAPGLGLPDNYGLTYSGEGDTTTAPLTATFTDTGKEVFSDLNTANPITIKNAWAYFGTSPDATTTPLLTTDQGYVIASTHTYPDGRQNLAVTVLNNPNLVHSELLSYGLIDWVTKGVFLGERHVNLGVQVDDLFTTEDIWPMSPTATPTTERMTAADYQVVTNWQTATQASALFGAFHLEFAFNGEGTAGTLPDDLTLAVIANNSQFNFINHTFSHQNLDCVKEVPYGLPCSYIAGNTQVTHDQVLSELSQNDNLVTSTLHFTSYNYDRNSLIQPDISGLNSPQSLQAMFDFGIRYIISDTSRPGWNNPTPNAGFYSAYQPSILIIPRRPSNLFANLTTPAQWVSEYNCYYSHNLNGNGSSTSGTCRGLDSLGQPVVDMRYWDNDLSYQEILDKESDVLLSYMLRWDLDPWMFHTSNTTTYDNVHTLLGDLLVATFAKYQALYNLPVRSMALREIGPVMANRMSFDKSGVTGSITCPVSGPGTMTITTKTAATIPVTGVSYGSKTETYGGQAISYIAVGAGQSVQIPAPASVCPSTDLSITKTDGVTNVSPGTGVTYTIVARNVGATDVNGARVTDTLPVDLSGATWTCSASDGSTCTTPSGSGNIDTTVHLRAGGSATFSVSTSVVASSASSILTNTATIAPPAGIADPNTTNNTATDVDTVSPVANLSVTNTDGVTSVTPGVAVTYTIVASNAGPSDVIGATIADTLPTDLTNPIWSCAPSAGSSSCAAANGTGNISTTASLPAGSSVTFTVSGTVASIPRLSTMINTVTIAVPAGTADPVTTNNSATDTDAVWSANLSITNTDGVTSVAPGTAVTYTIVAANLGPSAVTGAKIADTLPTDLTGASWTCTATKFSSCAAANGNGNINTTANLAKGSSVIYTVRAVVVTSPGASLSNTATVALPAGWIDPAPANNSAIDLDTVSASASPQPALPVLDSFDRANATTLGTNWSQSGSALRVNNNQAYAYSGGTAYWNATGSTFGTRQGAAFTFATTPSSSQTSLLLKASGGTATAPTNYISVAYNGSQVIVSTISGGVATVQARFTTTYALGNTFSAVALNDGSVTVYKTVGTTTTVVGTVLIPTSGSMSGRVGIQLPSATRIDNFQARTITSTVVGPQPQPALPVLDSFTRANATTLGTNWSQSGSALRVNNNQAYAYSGGTAYWKTSFGSRQGAAFTFATSPTGQTSLLLKASGGTTPSGSTSYISVAYNGSQVIVSTISGGVATVQARFTTTYALGNTFSAVALNDGSVTVYKTVGTTTTVVGTVLIPTSGTGAWSKGTGGGYVGIQLPKGARVDNFQASTVP